MGVTDRRDYPCFTDKPICLVGLFVWEVRHIRQLLVAVSVPLSRFFSDLADCVMYLIGMCSWRSPLGLKSVSLHHSIDEEKGCIGTV